MKNLTDPIETMVLEELSDTTIDDLLQNKLVVFNDDHNSFEHVEECFMKYLKHSREQAGQCALIIHNTGKCSVKNGTFEELEPYKTALQDEGLTVEIQ